MLLIYLIMLIDWVGCNQWFTGRQMEEIHVAPSSPASLRPASCGLVQISLTDSAPSPSTQQHQYDKYNKPE